MIESVHLAQFIHRDIKPCNFSIGPRTDAKEIRTIYLIDFGMARKFTDENGLYLNGHITLMCRQDQSCAQGARLPRHLPLLLAERAQTPGCVRVMVDMCA